MIDEMKFSNKIEYGTAAGLGLWGSILISCLQVFYLKRLGYSGYVQIASFIIVIVLCTGLSVLVKYLMLSHKRKNNIIVMNQLGYECYMPLTAYAFPIPECLEQRCVIQNDYVSLVVDEKIKVGNGVEVEPKQLSDFELEPGQRYYIATDLESEAKTVVPDKSRGWWPYRIVG